MTASTSSRSVVVLNIRILASSSLLRHIWSCIICWRVSSTGEMQPWKIVSGTWLRAVCCEWREVHGHVCRTWGCWHYPEWAPVSSQTSKDFAVLSERVQEHLPGLVMMIFRELLFRPVFMSLTNSLRMVQWALCCFIAAAYSSLFHYYISFVSQSIFFVSNSLLTRSVPLCLFNFNLTLVLLVLDNFNETVECWLRVLISSSCADPTQLSTNIFRRSSMSYTWWCYICCFIICDSTFSLCCLFGLFLYYRSG